MTLPVLLTGSSGKVGREVVPRLVAAGVPLRVLDLTAPPEPVDGVEVVVGSFTDPAVLGRALDGVGAVVHLAGESSEAPWSDILSTNVDGSHVLLEAALRAGVGKVVLASSHHATGMTPRPAEGELPGDEQFRPDTYYGWSKAAGEALGRLFVDRHGLDVVALRIGSCAAAPVNVRALSTWLSFDDCTRLILAALSPEVTGWHCVWGISRNTRRWWSLQAGLDIGYDPQDDAESSATQVLAAADASEVVDLVGGQFTTFPLGVRP